MATEELDLEERLKALRIQSAYRQATRTEKGRILDALETATGLDRKTIIRRLNRSCQRKRRRKGRSRSYSLEVDDAVRSHPAREMLRGAMLAYYWQRMAPRYDALLSSLL